MSQKLYLKLEARSENESFARVVVAAFAARLEPTMEEISEIKTAVSEAVTNAVIHGYGPAYTGTAPGIIELECITDGASLEVIVTDHGVGIEDVAKAREMLYTTNPGEERSGMGFTFMELFMDSVLVSSLPGVGTSVRMKKIIGLSQKAVEREA